MFLPRVILAHLNLILESWHRKVRVTKMATLLFTYKDHLTQCTCESRIGIRQNKIYMWVQCWGSSCAGGRHFLICRMWIHAAFMCSSDAQPEPIQRQCTEPTHWKFYRRTESTAIHKCVLNHGWRTAWFNIILRSVTSLDDTLTKLAHIRTLQWWPKMVAFLLFTNISLTLMDHGHFFLFSHTVLFGEFFLSVINVII